MRYNKIWLHFNNVLSTDITGKLNFLLLQLGRYSSLRFRNFLLGDHGSTSEPQSDAKHLFKYRQYSC